MDQGRGWLVLFGFLLSLARGVVTAMGRGWGMACGQSTWKKTPRNRSVSERTRKGSPEWRDKKKREVIL